MERVKRQFWWSVGVMGIILAALLAFGAYYIALMLDKQNLQTARYLSHVAVQSRNTVAKAGGRGSSRPWRLWPL